MKKQYLALIICIITIPASLQSREFLNTVVHLNFGGMYTLASRGSIINSENSVISTRIPESTNTSHYETAYCATLDVVPTDPILLGMEDHAIKFGLRGAYRLHFLQQRVKAGDEIGDQVMDYRSWMVGPVIHYAPFIEPSDLNEDYTASGGFTLYALYGNLNGNLTAFPAVREKLNDITLYNTKIKGYKYDVGVGAELSLCALNVGVNIYYTFIKIKMKDAIYSDIGTKGYLKEGCLELYVGIPIESFIEPLIPKF